MSEISDTVFLFFSNLTIKILFLSYVNVHYILSVVNGSTEDTKEIVVKIADIIKVTIQFSF